MIGSSTILTSNNNYQNMQYLHVGHNSGSNLQYPHLGLSFIDMKGSKTIKMVVSSFNTMPSYLVYHTLIEVRIM